MATKSTSTNEIRRVVKVFYSIQKLRCASYNRIVDEEMINKYLEEHDVRIDEIKPEKLDKEQQKAQSECMNTIMEKYESIREEVDAIRTVKGRDKKIREIGGPIKNVVVYDLVKACSNMQAQEDMLQTGVKFFVDQEDIWKRFLVHVKGIGPLMAGCIISELDIHKARHVSSFWKYCGMDVVEVNGEMQGRGKKEGHLVDWEYTDKNGDVKIRKGITYNPFIKSKLLGVVGDLFIKLNSQYKKVYTDYKNRLENHPKYKDVSKGRRHNMAVRYMIKMFLKDLWVAWREIEGYPYEGCYWEDKISGRKHGVNYAPIVALDNATST